MNDVQEELSKIKQSIENEEVSYGEVMYLQDQTKENPTKQRKPSFGKGGVPTPPGFEAHPERRHNGAWKKEDTARFKLEQMLKLDAEELTKISNDAKAPLFERRIARSLLKENNWQVTEKMINQVYGMPKQEITQTNVELQPILPKPKKTKK